jgi:hypothetical protein
MYKHKVKLWLHGAKFEDQRSKEVLVFWIWKPKTKPFYSKICTNSITTWTFHGYIWLEEPITVLEDFLDQWKDHFGGNLT